MESMRGCWRAEYVFLLHKVGGTAEKYEGLLNSWKKKGVNLQQQQNVQSDFGVKSEKIEVFPLLEHFVIELKRVWKYLHDETFKSFTLNVFW